MPPATSCLSAASVPCTRNGRSNCASVAWPVGGLRPPGIPQDAADDPVGAGEEPVDGGVVGVDEQVASQPRLPPKARASPSRSTTPATWSWVREAGGCRDARAERVSDEDRALDVQPVLEALVRAGASGASCRGRGAGCSRTAAGRARRPGGLLARAAGRRRARPRTARRRRRGARRESRACPSCGRRGVVPSTRTNGPR